ncbi:MAG TPA: alanine racemase [Stellaceae bacterium]|nr:alanine racemase [Stellaceae bacterium]HEV2263996.1 alanine racemase [Stellaceae bacterium]
MPSDRKVATDRANAILEIDLRAVAANWRRLKRELAPGARLAAVIKADAYGLGAAEVGPVLARAGCGLFFVASLDEGIALRKILPKARIAVLDGVLAKSEAEFARRRLVPVLNDLDQAMRWSKAYPGKPAILHLDTGMERLGLSRRELDRLTADRSLLARLDLAAIMSHLACADEPEHPKNPEQLARFRAALARLPKAPASLASSSAIFLGPAYHFQIVRPGAALFGINPLPGKPNPMRAVVVLKARILQVRDVDAGETVGYGATHRMERPSRIATVAVGYADGWLRSASDRGSAAIAGRRVPLVGRISMDLLTLDVTGIEADRAKPGAYVDLLDDSYGIDDAAAAARTISYEMLTLLGRRYARVYRGAR